MAATRKPRKKQKMTLSRTKVSRRARRIRRDYFNRAMELEVARREGTPDDVARAERRYANAEAAFKTLPMLARKLEVSPATAAAELDGDDEGDDE